MGKCKNGFRPGGRPTKEIVTVHSVTGNTLRDAQKSQKDGISAQNVRKPPTGQERYWRITRSAFFSSLLTCACEICICSATSICVLPSKKRSLII